MDFIKIMQDDKIIGVLNLQYDFNIQIKMFKVY